MKKIFVLLCLFFALPLMAATRTWDGGGAPDGKWNTADNWSDNTVPTTGDTALFDATSAANCTSDVNWKIGARIVRVGYTGRMVDGGRADTCTMFDSIGSGGTMTMTGSIRVQGDYNYLLTSSGSASASGLDIYHDGTGNITLKTSIAVDSVRVAQSGKTNTFTAGNAMSFLNLYGGTATFNARIPVIPYRTRTFDQGASTLNGSATFVYQNAATSSNAITSTLTNFNYTGTADTVIIGSNSTSSGLQTVALGSAFAVSRGLRISKDNTANTSFSTANYGIAVGSSYPLILGNTNATGYMVHDFGSSVLSFGKLDTVTQAGYDTLKWGSSVDTCYGDYLIGSKQIVLASTQNLIFKNSSTLETRGWPMYDVTFINGGIISNATADTFHRVQLSPSAGGKKLVLTAGKETRITNNTAGDFSGSSGSLDSLVSSSSGSATSGYFNTKPIETYAYIKDLTVTSPDTFICTTGCVDGGGNTKVKFVGTPIDTIGTWLGITTDANLVTNYAWTGTPSALTSNCILRFIDSAGITESNWTLTGDASVKRIKATTYAGTINDGGKTLTVTDTADMSGAGALTMTGTLKAGKIITINPTGTLTATSGNLELTGSGILDLKKASGIYRTIKLADGTTDTIRGGVTSTVRHTSAPLIRGTANLAITAANTLLRVEISSGSNQYFTTGTGNIYLVGGAIDFRPQSTDSMTCLLPELNCFGTSLIGITPANTCATGAGHTVKLMGNLSLDSISFNAVNARAGVSYFVVDVNGYSIVSKNLSQSVIGVTGNAASTQTFKLGGGSVTIPWLDFNNANTGQNYIDMGSGSINCPFRLTIGTKPIVTAGTGRIIYYGSGTRGATSSGKRFYSVVDSANVGATDTLASNWYLSSGRQIKSGKFKFMGFKDTVGSYWRWENTVVDSLMGRTAGAEIVFDSANATFLMQGTGRRLIDSLVLTPRQNLTMVLDSNITIKALTPIRSAAAQKWTMQANRTLTELSSTNYAFSGQGGVVDSTVSSTPGTYARYARSSVTVDSSRYLKDVAFQGFAQICTVGCFNGGNDSNVVWDTAQISAISPASIPLAGGLCTLTVVHGRTSGGSVTVGGTAATISEQTATRIIFTAPAKTAGAYDVVFQSGLGFDPGDDTASLTYAAGSLGPISYATSPLTIHVDSTISQTITNGGDPLDSFTISPALPLGMRFNKTTGAITGATLIIAPATGYTITGYGGAETTTCTDTITVIDYNNALDTAYILRGATGTNAGTSWTNAYTTIPASCRRNTLYYIGAGVYPQDNTTWHALYLDDMGRQPITFKRATTTEHGDNTGWSDAFDDTVTLPPLYIIRQNYVFDGVTGGGIGNYLSGYKMRVFRDSMVDETMVTIRTDTTQNRSYYGSHIKFYNVWFGQDTMPSPGADRALNSFQYGGSNLPTLYPDSCVFDSCLFKRFGDIGMTIVGGRGWEFRNCRFDSLAHWGIKTEVPPIDSTNHGSGLELYGGYGGMHGLKVYNCALSNIERTGWIGAYGDTIHDMLIYGNVFFNAANDTGSWGNGIVYNTSTGGYWKGLKVYNNTFSNLRSDDIIGITRDAGGNEFKNNIVGYIKDAVAPAYTGGTYDYNASFDAIAGDSHLQTLTSNIFTDTSTYDYLLTVNTTAGANLGASYTPDAYGTARATWSRGAYEYQGSTPINITSVTPNRGDTLGGDTVRIRGVSFGASQGSGTVFFGDSAAASYEAWLDTLLTVTTKAHLKGYVSVIVTTDVPEQDTLVNGFYFGVLPGGGSGWGKWGQWPIFRWGR
jgi:hypothetical protein